MAPIHDTDIEETRGTDWSKEQWKDYELWEAIDARERRRKRLWIALTAVLFFVLLAVPVWRERSPLWSANQAAMRLAREIALAKKEAALSGLAIRVSLVSDSSNLSIRRERVTTCAPTDKAQISGETLPIQLRSQADGLAWLPEAQAEQWSVPNLISSICYDSIAGSSSNGNFAIIPVKDLTEGRSDRVAILQVSGNGADAAIAAPF